MKRFERRGQMHYVGYFRHFDMRIAISPHASVDCGISRHGGTTDVPGTPTIQNAAIAQRRILAEEKQCQMFQEALNCFAQSQYRVFGKLRSLTLEVGFHSPHPPHASDHLNQCGSILRITIKLEDMSEEAATTCRKQLAAMQEEMAADLFNLEPRRRMLAPLAKLKGVRRVEVHRK